MSRKTRIAALAATVAAVGAMSVAAAPALAFSPIPLNRVLTGSFTPKKLAQAIALPSGSEFTGTALLTGLAPPQGEINGTTTVPPWSTTVKVFGSSQTIGLTFTSTEEVHGHFIATNVAFHEYLLAVPVKANLGFTSIKVFGLTFKLECKTAEPVAL